MSPARLEAIVADRNRAQKHGLRARIVLQSAERLAVAEVARRIGVGRPAVWRWQRRFAEAGVDGLLRDATRKPGKTPLADATVRRVAALNCAEPPGEATPWTGRAMAKTAGISLRSVQRVWATHDLQPHRIRTFKRSNDPAFADKLHAHSLVLSVDEKSQIQALDRTQPGLPLKPGTMTLAFGLVINTPRGGQVLIEDRLAGRAPTRLPLSRLETVGTARNSPGNIHHTQ